MGPARGDITCPQQELADRIGVTHQTVNAMESNKYSPSLEVAFRVARVFDVTGVGVTVCPGADVASAAAGLKRRAGLQRWGLAL